MYQEDHNCIVQLDVVSTLDVVGPFAFLQSHTSKDNVHTTLGFLTSLACAILLVRKMSQNLSLPGVRGLLPPPPRTLLLQLPHEGAGESGSGALPNDRYDPVTLRTISISNIPLSDGYQYE